MKMGLGHFKKLFCWQLKISNPKLKLLWNGFYGVLSYSPKDLYTVDKETQQ